MTILELAPSELRQGAHHTRGDLSVCQVHDLVRSIKAHGQLVPIEITGTESRYVIHDGCRRTLACAKLGIKVRARVIEPFPSIEDARMAYYATNYVRRPAAPTAVIVKAVHDGLESYAGRRRKAVRWLAYEYGISLGRVEYFHDLWGQLLAKDPREAEIAIAERWSVPEIGRALGFPTQRERKGIITRRPAWSTMRPDSVRIKPGKDGVLRMVCTMNPRTDPRALRSYLAGKRWPEPVLVGA